MGERDFANRCLLNRLYSNVLKKECLKFNALLIMRPNNNTLKCKLKSTVNVTFAESERSIERLLGFTENKVLGNNITHTSNAPASIIKMYMMRIRYNNVQVAYKNGQNEQTLDSFYPPVEPGFKIVETATNVIILLVNIQVVGNITLSVVDF